MNKYGELAEKILDEMRKDDFKSETVMISIDDAIKIYNALSGMSTIMKIVESDYGGAEQLR